MPTPILQLPLVSPNQNQKETTINTALAILEGASNDARVITVVANANVTLTNDQFTRWMFQRVQGNTAPMTVQCPAFKRFFVVANEGSEAVTFFPAGGTALLNGAEVPAGKIVLMMSDGVDVRALSSGVSRLEDLTDVNTGGAADNQVLLYVIAEEKWRPATIAEALNVGFIGLTDTPTDYVGDAGKLVRVNAGATGLEFVLKTDLGLNFTDLADTPNSLGGQADKLVAVNDDGTALILIDSPPMSFTQLTDVPDSLVGMAGKLPVVNGAETGIEFVDVPPVGDYTGQAGKAIIVNATEDGVEFTEPGATAFTGLTDAPAAYTGQAGKAVLVKATEDGLEFGDATGGGSVAVQEDDVEVVPAAATLNFEGAGVSVVDDGAGKVTITVPGGGGSGGIGARSYWRVRATRTHSNSYLTVAELEFRATAAGADQTTGGTASSSSNYSGSAAANAFDDNNSTMWSSNDGDIASDGAWIGYQFATPVEVTEVSMRGPSLVGEALLSGYVEYSDDGTTWIIAWRIPVQAAWTVGETRVFNISGAAQPSLLDLTDTPDDYVSDAGKKLRVNGGATAVEFVADTFLSQTDTPSNYTGAAKKKVRVNSAGNALEFVTNAIEIETTQTAAYTAVLDDADNTIPVNVATAVDVTIPTDASVAYPNGTMLSVLQLGAGQVGMVGAVGVTVNRPAALTNLTREQFSVVMALKIAANSWVLLGDLEPNP